MSITLPPLPIGKDEFDVMSWDDIRARDIEVSKCVLEAAAKVCDAKAKRNFPWASENSDKYHAQADWAELCAASIRALAVSHD